MPRWTVAVAWLGNHLESVFMTSFWRLWADMKMDLLPPLYNPDENNIINLLSGYNYDLNSTQAYLMVKSVSVRV